MGFDISRWNKRLDLIPFGVLKKNKIPLKVNQGSGENSASPGLGRGGDPTAGVSAAPGTLRGLQPQGCAGTCGQELWSSARDTSKRWRPGGRGTPGEAPQPHSPSPRPASGLLPAPRRDQTQPEAGGKAHPPRPVLAAHVGVRGGAGRERGRPARTRGVHGTPWGVLPAPGSRAADPAACLSWHRRPGASLGGWRCAVHLCPEGLARASCQGDRALSSPRCV